MKMGCSHYKLTREVERSGVRLVYWTNGHAKTHELELPCHVAWKMSRMANNVSYIMFVCLATVTCLIYEFLFQVSDIFPEGWCAAAYLVFP